MKGNTQFKNTIKAHLDAAAASNELFAAKYANTEKNIDKCIEYILGEVSASGESGSNTIQQENKDSSKHIFQTI